MFKRIQEQLSVVDVASHYGLKVTKDKMCSCPFHQDRHPSMKLNRNYFYCFSCTATGDAIGLVARMYGLTQKDAALMIIKDLGLDIKAVIHKPKQLNTENDLRAFHLAKRDALFVLHRYMYLLEQARKNFAPQTPAEFENCHELFEEALKNLDFLYELDDQLENSDLETLKEILETHGGTITNVRNRLYELNQL